MNLTTEALRYGAHCRGLSQFYLHTLLLPATFTPAYYEQLNKSAKNLHVYSIYIEVYF